MLSFKVHWLEGDNVDRTLVILNKLTNLLVSWVERGLVDQETIYGIALLNEPWGVDQNVWQEVRDNFYPKGYQVKQCSLEQNGCIAGCEERNRWLE